MHFRTSRRQPGVAIDMPFPLELLPVVSDILVKDERVDPAESLCHLKLDSAHF